MVRPLHIAVLALAAGLLVACSGADVDDVGDAGDVTGTVISASSDATTAELTIPEGALPEGASAGDISMTVSIEALDAASDGGGASVLTVNLQPSGLVFEDPLPLTITLDPSVRSALGVALTSDNGDFEMLEYELEFAAGSSEAPGAGTLVTRVSHFSEVVVLTGVEAVEHRLLEDAPSRPILVGEEFSVRTVASPLDWELERASPLMPDRIRPVEDADWGLRFRARGDGPVDWVRAHRGGVEAGAEDLIPDERSTVSISPFTPSMALSLLRGEPAVIRYVFRCSGPGEFSIELGGLAAFLATARGIIPEYMKEAPGVGDILEDTTIAAVVLDGLWVFGECVAPLVQEPEPTSTAGAVRDGSADDDSPPITMSVIKVGKESYPIEHLEPHGRVGGDCAIEHFHAPNGAVPVNPDADPIPDPRPGGCGFGTYDDIVDVQVSQPHWLVYQDRATALRDALGGIGIAPTPEGGEETIGVEVVVVNGERFPIEQFDVPLRDVPIRDRCNNREHYHSSLPSFSLEGGTLADPDPDGCGYATVDEVIYVEVTAEEWNRYRNLLAGN